MALTLLSSIGVASDTPSGQSDGSMQLVAVAGGLDVGPVVVENNELRVTRDGTTEPLPPDVRWELRGDLVSQRQAFAFSPPHRIVTLPAVPSTPTARERTYAIIRIRQDWAWPARDLKDAVIVCVWLVAGKPEWVAAMPAHLGRGPSEDYVALATRELDATSARGTPAVLAWRDGRWLTPRTYFEETAANEALAALHLESFEAFAREASKLKNPDIGARWQFRHRRLLELAAEAGNKEAVVSLLAAGARPTPESLVAAAANNRLDCLPPLLEAGARPRAEPADDSWDSIRYARERGHLAAALMLAGEKPGDDLDELFAKALEHADLPAAERLAGMKRRPLARAMDKGAWRASVATGDAGVVDLLLRAGMPADVVVDHIPLLVTAAARGDDEVVRKLLDAGAAIDRPASEGITPLMAAAYNGNATVVETLIQAGAKVGQADRRGNTARDYAAAGLRPSLTGLLTPTETSPAGQREGPSVSNDVMDHITALRVEAGEVLDERSVDLPPVLEKHVSAARSTRMIQDLQSIYRTETVTNPLEPGSPTYVITRLEPRGTRSSEALTNHWAGATLIVERDGSTSSVQIIGAVSAEFATAVREALRDYRFSPGRHHGEPVRTRITLPILLDD